MSRELYKSRPISAICPQARCTMHRTRIIFENSQHPICCAFFFRPTDGVDRCSSFWGCEMIVENVAFSLASARPAWADAASADFPKSGWCCWQSQVHIASFQFRIEEISSHNQITNFSISFFLSRGSSEIELVWLAHLVRLFFGHFRKTQVQKNPQIFAKELRCFRRKPQFSAIFK